MITDVRSEIINPNGWVDLNPIGIAIHHTAVFFDQNSTVQEEIDHIKAIDKYHDSLGWGGFGYHGITFPSGRNYHCGTITRGRAHTSGRNHELRGWALAGDFSTTMPSLAQLDGLRESLQFLLQDEPGLDMNDHNAWALPGRGTECPGVVRNIDWDSFVTGDPIDEIFYSIEEALIALDAFSYHYGIIKFNPDSMDNLSDPFKNIILDITGRYF